MKTFNEENFVLALDAMANTRKYLQKNASFVQEKIKEKFCLVLPLSVIQKTEELGVNFSTEEYTIDVNLPYPGDKLLEIRLVLTADFSIKLLELDKLDTVH